MKQEKRTPDRHRILDPISKPAFAGDGVESLKFAFDESLPGFSEMGIPGQNLIHPWGLEFAGRDFFYSINEAKRGLVSAECKTNHVCPNQWDTQAVVGTRSGNGYISMSESVAGNRITRAARLTTDREMEVTGLAMRYQFSKEFFPRALIANQEIQHHESLLYYMYEVESAELAGPKHRVQVSYTGGNFPAGMKRFIYVRDLPGRWVVHLRVLPDPYEPSTARIMRLPMRLEKFNRSGLVQRFADRCLTAAPLWSYFWHRVERIRNPIIPMGAYGLIPLGAASAIEIRGEVAFSHA